jgi:DNA-binding LacI/PurR family transcriptional regulator
MYQDLKQLKQPGRPAVLYQKIVDVLRNSILSSHYRPGEELPSERELCEQFSVSRITIRRALAELHRGGWIKSIPGKANIIRENAGTIIPPVQLLIHAQTFDMAMKHGNPTVLESVSGVIQECRRQNIAFNISAVKSEVDLALLRSERHCLVIFEWPIFKQLEKLLLETPDYPVVLNMFSLSEDWIHNEPELPAVLCDDGAGITEAVEWLIAQGRKNIIFIGKENMNYNLQVRLEAYRNTMLQNGMKPEVITSGYGSRPPEEFRSVSQVEYGRIATRKILESGLKPDGIIATNDFWAFGAVDVLTRAGIKVHEDCTVIGFDNSDLSKISNPPFYSISKPRQQTGIEAVKLLIQYFKEGVKRKMVLKSKFIPEL